MNNISAHKNKFSTERNIFNICRNNIFRDRNKFKPKCNLFLAFRNRTLVLIEYKLTLFVASEVSNKKIGRLAK